MPRRIGEDSSSVPVRLVIRGDALVWPLIGLMMWLPFGVGVVWNPKKDQRVKLTVRDPRVRRERLPMEKVNLLHVALLWLEGRSTADEQPVREWARRDRVVWVPLRDGRAFGVEFRVPAAFVEVFGAFAVEACGGPDIVRARAAAETYPEPRPVRPRPAEGAGSSWADVLRPARRRRRHSRVALRTDARAGARAARHAGTRHGPGRAAAHRAAQFGRLHRTGRTSYERSLVIRVVLVDDQPLIRSGFRALLDLEDDIEVVAEAADGQECLALVMEQLPDVALVDIQMPVMDGIEATRRIAADPALAAVHVVMLTNYGMDEYVFDALRAGAAGFLVKDILPEDLLHAVRVAARGDALLAPALTRRLIDRYITQPPRTLAGNGNGSGSGLAELTSREREAVVLAAHGLSNDEIAHRLVISPATAKTHINRAMIKLHARDRAQLVVLAYESGLVTPGTSP